MIKFRQMSKWDVKGEAHDDFVKEIKYERDNITKKDLFFWMK